MFPLSKPEQLRILFLCVLLRLASGRSAPGLRRMLKYVLNTPLYNEGFDRKKGSFWRSIGFGNGIHASIIS